MKFTLTWLKDHLETDATLDAIVDALTRLGLEVEGVDDPAAKLAGFITRREHGWQEGTDTRTMLPGESRAHEIFQLFTLRVSLVADDQFMLAASSVTGR